VRPLPGDEIGVVSKRGCEGRAIACIPGTEHPLMNGTD
jgi:hypothetical protein